MFGIEWPMYLWALTGLLLPLLIHLWNRQKSVPVKTGSVRWLKASKSRKVSKVKLTQLALLLLRMAMLAVFVLLMAKPFWQSDSKNQSKDIVLVQPSLLKLDAVYGELKELRKEGKEIRLLQMGFPEWVEETGYTQSGQTDIWALLQLAGEELYIEDTLRVFAYESARNFSHKKPVLSFITDLQLVPSRDSEYFLADAGLNAHQDSLIFNVGIARSNTIDFDVYAFPWKNQPAEFRLNEKEQKLSVFLDEDQEWRAKLSDQESVPIKRSERQKVFIHHDQAFETDYLYIQAALSAIQKHTGKDIQWDDQNISEADWVFWLSKQRVPDSLVNKQRQLLVVEASKSSVHPLIQKSTAYYTLNRRLDPEHNSNALKEPLASELKQLLFGYPQVWESAEAYDLRAVSMHEAQPYFEKHKSIRKLPISFDLHQWFWACLLFLFFIERSVALWKTH